MERTSPFRKLLTKLGEKTSLALTLRRIVEFGFIAEKRVIRAMLPLPSHARVLDLGCGTGEHAPLFPAEGYEGIDIDPANIAYAKDHYPYAFAVGDATKLAYPDASFDAIIVVGVFHHLTDADASATLAEMKRVLKPGGAALVMEDTQTWRPWTNVMQWLDQGAHIRTKEEWDRMFGSAFLIRDVRTFASGISFYTAYLLTHGN